MKSHVLNSIHHNSKIPHICNMDGLITLHIRKDLQIFRPQVQMWIKYYPRNNQIELLHFGCSHESLRLTMKLLFILDIHTMITKAIKQYIESGNV